MKYESGAKLKWIPAGKNSTHISMHQRGHVFKQTRMFVRGERGGCCPIAHLLCIFCADVSTNANLPSKSQKPSAKAAIASYFSPCALSS